MSKNKFGGRKGKVMTFIKIYRFYLPHSLIEYIDGKKSIHRAIIIWIPLDTINLHFYEHNTLLLSVFYALHFVK